MGQAGEVLRFPFPQALFDFPEFQRIQRMGLGTSHKSLQKNPFLSESFGEYEWLRYNLSHLPVESGEGVKRLLTVPMFFAREGG